MRCPKCESKSVTQTLMCIISGKDTNQCTCTECGYKWKVCDYEDEFSKEDEEKEEV